MRWFYVHPLLLLVACHEPKPKTEPERVPTSQLPEAVQTPDALTDPQTPRRCIAPPDISAAPSSIAAAVALINALPPPVTVACFVESLDRPLEVVATASDLSAQPAEDAHSPRIFIRNGPLTMVVVAGGVGQDLLEFGEAAGAGRTTKAELQLPPRAPLSASAPYERVEVGDGTTCATCHDDEAPLEDRATAYASEILIGPTQYDVALAGLRRDAGDCAATPSTVRCELLRALFDHGEVRPGSLPSGGRLCHGA